MPRTKSVVLTLSLIDQGGFEIPEFRDASSEISLIDQGGFETPDFGDASGEISGFDLGPNTFSILSPKPEAQSENIRVDYR